MSKIPRFVKTQAQLAEVLGLNLATLRKWIESSPDFPGEPGAYPLAACLCWMVCFSPQCSERGRDDYLHELIRRLESDAAKATLGTRTK